MALVPLVIMYDYQASNNINFQIDLSIRNNDKTYLFLKKKVRRDKNYINLLCYFNNSNKKDFEVFCKIRSFSYDHRRL